MKDKILTCQRCKSQFYFTVGEQQFYMSKGLNIPKLCKNCRNQKKQESEHKQNYVPKACSTCYFYGDTMRIWGWDLSDKAYAYFEQRKMIYSKNDYIELHVCERANEPIVNNAPCEHWTRHH